VSVHTELIPEDGYKEGLREAQLNNYEFVSGILREHFKIDLKKFESVISNDEN